MGGVERHMGTVTVGERCTDFFTRKPSIWKAHSSILVLFSFCYSMAKATVVTCEHEATLGMEAGC